MPNCRERLSVALAVRGTLEAPDRCVSPLAGRGVSLLEELGQFDEDLDRPLLVGYIRRELIATDAQVQEVERRMSLFADTQGFSIGFIFIDKPGIWPTVFESLTEAVRRHEVAAVVLPSLLHFAVLGATHDIKGAFERATGARVLLLDSPV